MTPAPRPAMFLLLASLLGTAAWTQSAHAQSCEDENEDFDFTCSPEDAGDAYYVGSSGSRCYDPDTEPSYTPDRRPGFWLNMFSGNQDCNNPKGHAAWWVNASTFGETNGLEARLDAAFDGGFRRILLNRPGGRVITDWEPPKVLQAQYGHLTDTQKAILDDFADWIECRREGCTGYSGDTDENFSIGIYLGSRQSGSSCTPCFQSTEGGYVGPKPIWDCSDEESQHSFTYNYRYFDPMSVTSMEEMYQNLKPWMILGCDMFGIDNTSRWDVNENGSNTDDIYVGPRRMLDLLQSPDYAGVSFIGEAAPRVLASGDPDYHNLDEEYSQYAAWITFYDVMLTREWLNADPTVAPGNEQSFSTANTDLGVIFHKPGNSPTYDMYDVAETRDRGYVVWVAHADAMKYVQRLYDGENDEFYDALYATGDLTDFDADGTGGTVDDFNAFCTNWNANRTLSGDDLAYWDGDIDNDDDVDCADLAAFLSLKSWGYTCINPCP